MKSTHTSFQAIISSEKTSVEQKMHKKLDAAFYTGKNIESLPELNSSLVKIILCSNTGNLRHI